MISIFFTILAGWLIADFLTGVVHWLEDRFGAEHWPILGSMFIAPNRRHHRDPMAFTRDRGFWYRNGTTMLAACTLGLVWLIVWGPSLLLGVLVVAGSFSNQIHYWAHCPQAAPAPVRHLQRAGIVQSRRHHGAHHVPPYTRNYCILTDWMNPVLAKLHFWATIERCIPVRWFAEGKRP